MYQLKELGKRQRAIFHVMGFLSVHIISREACHSNHLIVNDKAIISQCVCSVWAQILFMILFESAASPEVRENDATLT